MSATPGVKPWATQRGELTTTIYDARGYPVAIFLERPDRSANARFIEAAWPVSDALWSLLVALGQANLTPEQSAIVGPACDAASAALIASGRVMG